MPCTTYMWEESEPQILPGTMVVVLRQPLGTLKAGPQEEVEPPMSEQLRVILIREYLLQVVEVVVTVLVVQYHPLEGVED